MSQIRRNCVALLFIIVASTKCLSAAEPRPLEFPPAPVPIDQVVSKMKLPEGFTATLFAGEPDLVQPIAFTFDDRGRVWVAECLSYPKWTKDGTGRDRITIYEDTDGDGRHDRRTIFADNLANVSGLEYGFGGVWICSLPKLIFIPDRNGDDKPDGPAETMLDGWDENCRHNVFNGLAWGPDGWLYGLNGILSRSAVGKPGTPEAERVKFDCGVWRYHPVRKSVEAVAWGTTNPWGIDWDDYGELFITNCVIKHIFHAVPGGHYERMFGADPNPYVYGLLESCADHIHWAGGHWTDSRGGQGAHSDAGGGHAHSGCSVYLGDNFPDEYRNNVFMCNIHGNRLNRDRLERRGSGYVSKHAPDFMFANDPWFRGLNVKYGPDGAVYVSDWCDTGECHNYEVADVTNGRIVKVKYEGSGVGGQGSGGQSAIRNPKSATGFDLQKLTDAELVDLQLHKNDWWVRHARRVLQERAAAKLLQPDTVERLKKQLVEQTETPRRLRSLWALEAVGALDSAQLLAALSHDDEYVRGWGVEFAIDDAFSGNEVSGRLIALAKSDKSLVVRTRLTSALQRIDPVAGYRLGAMLVARAAPEDDHQTPLLTWYGLESISRRLTDFEGLPLDVWAPMISDIPLVSRLAARHVVLTRSGEAGDVQATSQSVGLLAQMAAERQDAHSLEICRGLLEALDGVRELPKPEKWDETHAKLLAVKSAPLRDAADRLGVIFGDEKLLAELAATLGDSTAEPVARRRALELLLPKRSADLLPMLFKLLDDVALRGDAVRALASYDDAKIAVALVSRFSTFTDAEKSDALQTLASRASYGIALLDAVAAGTIDRRDVPSQVALELSKLKDKTLAAKLNQVWGAVRPTSQARKDQAERLKKLLTSDVVKQADLTAGRALYAKTCAACHKLYDEGGAIGPELTGSQRFNLDYVLENVLDPSAKVGRLYYVTVFALDDGRVVQGIVVDENDRAVTVQTTTQKLTLAKTEIEEREETKLSMMPEGLFDRLSETELRDLVGYLTRR